MPPKNLYSVCRKVNGKRCTLAPNRFLTAKRLLENADKSRVPGVKQLKAHYCKRIKYLLEGQRKSLCGLEKTGAKRIVTEKTTFEENVRDKVAGHAGLS